MPHLRASVYNGHLRGPVTLTPIAERLAVGCCQNLRLRSVAAGIRRGCGANALTRCAENETNITQ